VKEYKKVKYISLGTDRRWNGQGKNTKSSVCYTIHISKTGYSYAAVRCTTTTLQRTTTAHETTVGIWHIYIHTSKQ